MIAAELSIRLLSKTRLIWGWLCPTAGYGEEYIVDPKTGVIINPNLLDYKLSTFLDIPEKEDMQKIIVERPCAWGPFGAKGMSETSMCALGPAVANAVYNATGVRIYDGFLSPANILKAIEKAKRNNG